jgi:hypothetical protein
MALPPLKISPPRLLKVLYSFLDASRSLFPTGGRNGEGGETLGDAMTIDPDAGQLLPICR